MVLNRKRRKELRQEDKVKWYLNQGEILDRIEFFFAKTLRCKAIFYSNNCFENRVD